MPDSACFRGWQACGSQTERLRETFLRQADAVQDRLSRWARLLSARAGGSRASEKPYCTYFRGIYCMKPVLKWAVGKTQLLKYIREMLPPAWNRYFEPFLGGGALLLDLAPQGATVNDINPELVTMYRQVRGGRCAVFARLLGSGAGPEGEGHAGGV